MDATNNNGGSKPVQKLRIPTRAEAEARRNQLEAAKPALHFKPTRISNLDSQSSSNATNSATAIHTTLQSDNRNTNYNSNDTQSSQILEATQDRQIQKDISRNDDDDDDFAFDDDLVLDDDIFDLDEGSTSTSNAPNSTRESITVIPDTTTQLVTLPPFLPKSKSTIVVRPSQKGNPVLQFIRNVPYEYGDIVPDFVVGLTSCIIFLSIRYHRLHPEYIFSRISALGKTYVLRVLLLVVDVDTHQSSIRELTRIAIQNDFTLICAWSNEEAARYIETYKAYENKAPDAIKERIDNDYLSKLTDSLTQIQSINKTDVVTLSSTFGSFTNIMNASVDELGILPGFGERKVQRLLEAFDQPFAIDPKKRKQRRK